jgi:hypothetical protein
MLFVWKEGKSFGKVALGINKAKRPKQFTIHLDKSLDKKPQWIEDMLSFEVENYRKYPCRIIHSPQNSCKRRNEHSMAVMMKDMPGRSFLVQMDSFKVNPDWTSQHHFLFSILNWNEMHSESLHLTVTPTLRRLRLIDTESYRLYLKIYSCATGQQWFPPDCVCVWFVLHNHPCYF